MYKRSLTIIALAVLVVAAASTASADYERGKAAFQAKVPGG